MDVLIQPHRSDPSIDHPATGPSDSALLIPPDLEAPDAGDLHLEAPEIPHGRQAEAPDAGEGRAALLEHEFTHGRSQS